MNEADALSSHEGEEIIYVLSGSAQVHFHRRAHAYVVCLGRRDGFPQPAGAHVFIHGQWRSTEAGEALDIPPGEPHGFTIETGGQ